MKFIKKNNKFNSKKDKKKNMKKKTIFIKSIIIKI